MCWPDVLAAGQYRAEKMRRRRKRSKRGIGWRRRGRRRRRRKELGEGGVREIQVHEGVVGVDGGGGEGSCGEE